MYVHLEAVRLQNCGGLPARRNGQTDSGETVGADR